VFVTESGLKDSTVRAMSPFDTDCYADIVARGLVAGLRLQQGTYAAVIGPSYETRAEIRMLRRLGADAVGMSTVPEVAAAATLGMTSVGLSLITNVGSDTGAAPLSHDDVVSRGKLDAKRIRIAVDNTLSALLDHPG
jgi:purine-nucleoside phosphorylase